MAVGLDAYPRPTAYRRTGGEPRSTCANRDMLARARLGLRPPNAGPKPGCSVQAGLRADLEAAVAKIRIVFPEEDVQVGSTRYGWNLIEGEAFVADLCRMDVSEISSPWPPPDTRGGWTWLWWTTEQLLCRLQLATKAALDVYQAIVDRHLPTMAPELHTYQLLPARIIGLFIPHDGSRGVDGGPRYSWFLEPLPTGSTNEAHWHVGELESWSDDTGWESRIQVVRALRGDLAERTSLTTHNGEPEILSSTPAGSLALKLLAADLSAFHWAKSGRFDMNSGSTRPHYS